MTDQELLEQYRGKDGFIHLQRTYSTLFEKTVYTTSLNLIINRITEYDIKAANVSALEASGKFSQKTIEQLRALPKEDREVTIGKMQREVKGITKIIQRGIKHAKEMLFEANMIQDNEVVSIKNDAVFVVGRKLKQTKFGSFQFVPKNSYSLFMKMDKLEFYYDGRHREVTIKGIGDDVLSEQDHKDGMLKFFDHVFYYLTTDRREELRRFLIEFVDDYKNKRLPVCYYRELNSYNIYRTIIEIAEFSYNLEIISEDDKEMINGIYNYKRFILPIVQTFL